MRIGCVRNDLAAAPFRTGFKYGAIAFALAVSRTSNARTHAAGDEAEATTACGRVFRALDAPHAEIAERRHLPSGVTLPRSHPRRRRRAYPTTAHSAR
jgi:hypothetical protein